MKDSVAKTLLNYSTALTKTTNKKLETTKSSDARIDIISKQFEDIKKKVNEVIDKGEPISEGESVIKVEFDKLNKRLDVIEATDYAQQNFVLGLLRNENSSTDSKSSNDSDDSDNSLVDTLGKFFGFDGNGKLDLDEILEAFTTGGFALDGLKKAFGVVNTLGKGIGSIVTNPYIMIPLAALAATIAVGKIVEDQANKAHEQTNRVDESMTGTTQEAVVDLFSKYSGGKSIQWYMEMLTEPGISDEEKARLRTELDDILNKVKDTTVSNISGNITDKGSAATIGANLAMDPESQKRDMVAQEKLILTGTDRFRSWLFGRDRDKLFTDSLSALDMSALGSLNGNSVSATDTINNISSSYGSLYNVDTSRISFNVNLNKGPGITEFNYSNPLESIKQISIEYIKLVNAGEIREDNEIKDKSNEEKFNYIYEKLFKSFTFTIGRKTSGTPDMTNWDEVRDDLKSVYTNITTWFRKNTSLEDYAEKVYKLIPNEKLLKEVYYSKSFNESDRSSQLYASKMTIAQQYSLLGASLDEHSSLFDINDTFYFLPIKVKVDEKEYTLDSEVRTTLNSTGILKAYKVHVDGSSELDKFNSDFDLLGEQAQAQNLRKAYDEVANSIGMVSLGDYSTDTIVMGQLKEYSGLTDKDELESFAKELEGYSYEQLLEASSQEGEVYNNILARVGNKNNAKKVINQLLTYQEDVLNSHKDDIIESYNLFNSDNKITSEDFDNMLDKISKDKSLRDKYMEARNTTDKSKKKTLYYEIGKILGLNTDMMGYTEIRNYVDRIFQNYVNKGLHDEEGEGRLDMDQAIHAYLGVHGFSTEDLSSSVNLFGLGTADELMDKYHWTESQLAEFLKLTGSMIDSQVTSNKDGSMEIVYNQSGIDKDSELVQNAVIEAIKSLGLDEGMAELLRSNGAISEAQYALLTNQNPTPTTPVNMGDAVVENTN